MKQAPAFSVLMITYNHEHFLPQAISSVLQQKFNGPLEIIIGVDKCTDQTLEVCLDYKARYPEIIQLIVHETNVGMYQNFVSVLKACRGKYIAILEGDDYWTDPLKLQRQFDFFERHPNCVLSAGLAGTLNGSVERNRPPFLSGFSKGKAFSRKDLVFANRLTTLTTAFRRDALKWSELEKLSAAPHLDWGLYLCLDYENNGFAYRFNRPFGVYRMHAGGVYSMVQEEKRTLNFLKTIYAVATLDLGPSERRYLQSLFINYAQRLKAKDLLLSPPYLSFYNEELLIYNQKRRVKASCLRAFYGRLFRRAPADSMEAIRTCFELVRQTKRSSLAYLDLRLLPIVVSACVIKLAANVRKQLVFA